MFDRRSMKVVEFCTEWRCNRESGSGSARRCTALLSTLHNRLHHTMNLHLYLLMGISWLLKLLENGPLLFTLNTGEVGTNDTDTPASASDSWLKLYPAWPSPRPLVQSATSAAPAPTAVSGCPGSSCGLPWERGPPPSVPASNALPKPWQGYREKEMRQEEGCSSVLLQGFIGKIKKKRSISS